jgi:rod shape-determining protein MreD
MRKRSDADIARTRAFWLANRPSESAAPAYTADPPPWWIVAVALIVALLVQASFAPFIAIRGATPSLVTLVVAWYALRTGVAYGLAFGLFAGACEDALGGGTGVAWTFATGFAGAAAGRLARTWLADTIVVLVPGSAVLTFARFVVFAVAMSLGGRSATLGPAQVHVALWQSALDALLVYIGLRTMPSLGGLRAHGR